MDICTTIVQHADTIYMVIDSIEKKLIYTNSAFKKLLGYEPDLFLNKEFTLCLNEIVPWENENLLHQFIQQEFDEQVVHIRLKDQTIAPFHVKGHRIIENGLNYYFLHLHAYESELLSVPFSHSSHKEAIDSLNILRIGYWVLYDITKPGYFSDTIYNLTGLTPNDLQPTLKSVFARLHPEDRSTFKNKIKAFLTSANTYMSSEMRLMHANNQWHWFYIRCHKIDWDQSQNSTRKVMGIVTDIDHRKKTEIALLKYNRELKQVKEGLTRRNRDYEELLNNLRNEQNYQKQAFTDLANQEKLFRQVTENIGDVIWVRNDKTILYINSAFEQVWGRSSEQVIHDPGALVNWIHPDDRKDFETWIHLEQLSSNEPFIEQYRIVKPDGNIRWIWSRTFPVFDENGMVYRIVGVASDITELKQYENALKEAKEKAQESDKLKSAFLANISHEIRTPMNGIVGFAELITKSDMSDEMKESYIDIIKKSSNQLIRIIDDIINISKIEANLIELKVQPLNIRKLFNDIDILFQNQLKLLNVSNVNFSYDILLKDFQEEILSDEIRLKQIITNLLNNAIKYTPSGSIQLRCYLEGENLIFAVKDTGIGIAPEKQSIIFEHFRQADEGNTRKFGGTGLGLSISKGLIQLFEGDIWFESKLNQGSTFYFSIPFIPCDNKLHPEEKAKFLASSIRWPDKAILIVEDEPLNYEFLKAILKPTGAMLIHAENGSQAVKMCNNLEFHVILMDIRLPVMSGLEATQRIREKGINTPIIAQTAYSLKDDKQTCLDAGCTDYLTKPLKKEYLIRMIDYYMNHPQSKELFSEI